MSALVRLSSKLAADPELNGLDAQRGDLVDEPDQLRAAIVWYDTQKVTIDTDSDEHIPTVRLRRIEPLGLISQVPAAVRDAVDVAVEKRTGRTPIPFEDVTVDGFDPDQLELEE